MGSGWPWLVVTLVVIFAMGLGGFAVWFVAWRVRRLTAQPRRRETSTDVDTDRPSRRAPETISFNLPRRDSWPLQSSLLRAQTVAYRNCSPEAARSSVRWPFLGWVRNDLFSASSLLSLESGDDDRSDNERPKTASELESNPLRICRYVAKPGPRAPLPCDWYDGQEVTASTMQLKPSSAKLSGFSSPMRN